MTGDLTAFLRARLNDDEQAAKAAALTFGGASHWEADQVNDPDYGIQRFMHIGDRTLTAGLPGDEEDPLRSDELAHIARHDPARLLREVEAKRRRLARHVPERRRLTLTDDTGATSLAFYVCTWCTPNRLIEQGQAVVEWPCPDVRDDVAAYADHPDYREEWRP